MQIEITNFGSKRQIESVTLRDTVLRKPLGLAFSKEELEQEEEQIHIVATEDKEVVGVLLLNPLSSTEIKMRQVAVDGNLQRRGIGIQMVRYAEYHSRAKGFTLLSLHAREGAMSFYNNLNYKVVGEKFTEVGIDHYRMEKGLEIK